MASCRVEFERSAAKDPCAIDRQWIPKILDAIESLSDELRPAGCKKLAGSGHTFRIRTGDGRLVYDLQAPALIVSVIRARHGRDVYR